MKKLTYYIPLLFLTMALTACQKENIIQDQTDAQPEVLALKKHPVPFHAEFVSTVLSADPNPEVCDGMEAPVFNLLQSLEGKATHLGKITGSVSSCINPVPPPTIFNGEVTFIAANGDELYFFQTGPLSFDINGGTGRFEDATGSITGFFERISADPTQFYNEFNGEIQY